MSKRRTRIETRKRSLAYRKKIRGSWIYYLLFAPMYKVKKLIGGKKK